MNLQFICTMLLLLFLLVLCSASNIFVGGSGGGGGISAAPLLAPAAVSAPHASSTAILPEVIGPNSFGSSDNGHDGVFGKNFQSAHQSPDKILI